MDLSENSQNEEISQEELKNLIDACKNDKKGYLSLLQKDSETGNSKCTRCKAGQGSFVGYNANNFKRHLVRKHAALAEALGVTIKRKLETSSESSKRLHTSPAEAIQACVEMCTIGGIPYTMMDFKPFRKLIQHAQNEIPYTINSANIKKYKSLFH
jgi:hypothetical protein